MNKNTLALLTTLTLLPSLQHVRAGSATWNLNPTSADWNTTANWTPATVPNDPLDTATFGVSNTTEISLSSEVKLDSIVFDAGASAYTISSGAQPSFSLFTIGGDGIVNNSGITQEFILSVDTMGGFGSIWFLSRASAGTGAVYTVSGSISDGYNAIIQFLDRSTAGDATFMIGGGSGDWGGLVTFSSDAIAGNATFICDPNAPGAARGAIVGFNDTSSAGNSTIVVNGPAVIDGVAGQADFFGGSTAANATLIARGTKSGVTNAGIYFSNQATGDRARVEVFGTGFMTASDLTTHSLPLGSIEGDGGVSIYQTHLLVGRNNLSTNFTGVISGDGSVTKVGEGKLVLAGANTYSGDTHIQHGTLVINNTTGSGSGTGNVTVDGGTLAGAGIISGAVTVDSGSGFRATLKPGTAGGTSARLSIGKNLTLNSAATCRLVVNSGSGAASGTTARGVTINGAQVALSATGTTTLPAGTVFTVIDNTAPTAISGTFSNLADGSTVTVGSNTFQANYEGGDGNDLTLTVVR